MTARCADPGEVQTTWRAERKAMTMRAAQDEELDDTTQKPQSEREKSPSGTLKISGNDERAADPND